MMCVHSITRGHTQNAGMIDLASWVEHGIVSDFKVALIGKGTDSARKAHLVSEPLPKLVGKDQCMLRPMYSTEEGRD